MKRFLRAFLFIVLFSSGFLSFPLSSSSQGVEAWTNLGLFGGQIYDIAIDPSNPDKMFVGAYMGDGLYMTKDGGKTWRAVEAENEPEGEGTFKNHAVWAVKIALSNHKVVWAAHNQWVEKSVDGGETWIHILNSTMQRDCEGCGGDGDNFRFCRSVAIDPTDSEVVYVGTGGPWSSYPSGAIYKTEDGGETWEKMNQGNDFDHSVTDIDIDPQDSGIIWAVTSSFGVGGWESTLYRSGDGGETWTDIHTLAGGRVTVAVKPNDSNTVFTGGGWGLEKHYFDGTEWQYIFPVLPEDYPNDGCRSVLDIDFDPQNPETIYICWKNSYFGDKLPKVSRSINGGVVWETYPVDYTFNCLAVHPTNSEKIFGGELCLGVYKSKDHGQTWTERNNGINAVIVYDVENDPNDSVHMVAGTLSGLYERKPGEDWSRVLPYSTRSVRFHPTDSLTFYAGLDIGYVAKTTDGGLHWDYSYLGSSVIVYDIAIDSTNTDSIYIAVDQSTDAGGKIYKSQDGGALFSEVLVGQNLSEEPYDFNVVKIDPSDPEHIFAGGGNFFAPKVLGDLWESTDGGVTWDRNPLSLKGVIVNDMLVDPANPDIMYAGCGYSGGTRDPVYKSTDGGVTWTASYGGIPGYKDHLRGVWGSSGTDVFAVGSNGIILRYNGTTWATMDSATTQELYDVWGSSGTDVFAVGTNGIILRYNGSTWATMESNTTETLWGVWGSSGTDVFAVGNAGTIVHYDGDTWSPMSSGTAQFVRDVWGSSSTDVFAVGDSGTILHYDGGSWSAMSSGTSEGLNGVWGSSSTDVFVVGYDGTILHYDGSSWTAMSSGTTEELADVWGSSGTDVFAVGNDGAKQFRRQSEFAERDIEVRPGKGGQE